MPDPVLFTLTRQAQNPRSTWGSLCGPDGRDICKILERGRADPKHPRIPAGIYTVTTKPVGASEFDGTFKGMFGTNYHGILWLPDVPGRTNIEIHTANFVDQLLGCLATGTEIAKDENGDFMITGGTSIPAYRVAYPPFAAAIVSGGAQLKIIDPN